MFYNPAFVDKINDIQAEFEQLLAERNAISPTKIGGLRAGSPTKGAGGVGVSITGKVAMKEGADLKGDEFYKAMDMIYGGKNPPKHKSPTKRLMQQKDAAVDHKTFLSKNL